MQTEALSTLDERQRAELAYRWHGWQARPSQEEPSGDWIYWLVMAGRGFGKTRIGAEWVREQVKKYPRVGLIGKDAADMHSVMIEGESGILAVCPKWERPRANYNKQRLEWPNGAISEFRTGEDPEGVRGVQFHRVWADELAAWQYPQDTWDMVLLALRLGDDVRACITTTPKPIRTIRDLIGDPNTVVTRGSTYENLPNLSPTFRTIIGRYEGTRLGRQELEGELLEDEGMAYRFDERVHCVPSFTIPEFWQRSEGMDFGSSAPTAWLVFASDTEGNYVCFDEFYEPGMPSETAPKILERRARDYRPQPWQGYDVDGWATSRNIVWGDPQSMANRPPIPGRFGVRTTIGQEFSDSGVPVTPANNIRDAGYIRIAELLKLNPIRRFPQWHPRAGQTNAPRLYFFGDRCVNIVEQLKDAPIEDTGKLAGQAVQGEWESSDGHAHAALRYWALSRAAGSTEPEYVPETPEEVRAEAIRERFFPQDDTEDNGPLAGFVGF